MKHLILLLLLIEIITCDDFERFYDSVVNRINEINQHVRATNNSYMYSTNDSTIYNGGSYDFIIVGGGSAGSVLASRLSEINDWSILLVEAGGFKDNFSDIPALSSFLQISDMDWGYLTTPQKHCCLGMKNNQCVYPRGKVIGGSSTINGLVYTRGNKDDFDEWEKLGNPGWSYKDVLPFFIKSERNDIEKIDKGYHGFYGPLHVNLTSPSDVTTEYVKKAFNNIGVKEVDVNGRQQLGTSIVPLNINFNKRCSGYNTFITPIEKRRNLKILLNAFVFKLIFNKNEAKGILYNKNGKIYKATVKKELILSAGAVNTPQILMLSGIGPEEDLTKLGIDVIHNLPGVGAHLQDHPHLFIPIRTNITRDNFTLAENLKKYVHAKTPLTRGLSSELISFTKLNGDSYSNIELLTEIPSSISPNPKQLYNSKYNTMSDLNITTDFLMGVILLKPLSVGKVSLKSKNPSDFPLIDIRYFSDQENIDINTMYESIKYVMKLIQTNEMRKINASYISQQRGCEHLLSNECKISGYQNDCDKNYWHCAIRRYSSTTYHPVGTARMGPVPKYHVVDHNCRVHYFKNFRIVDASVIPNIISGHINAVVYMIAEKISDIIKVSLLDKYE
ncbi:glucose dehydrogenase [FAD, quinone]-like [Diorhabda sublineata]|uniref:glucose dehydrogenase [FAD, quinone]-like n=1 Tax=Diorhabda sublineata TaxID=1163346 RepID=UPI0024E0FBE3|nr:glucose dehydrogenase [FAD, quinone]-like [Diorhabda sublineata]